MVKSVNICGLKYDVVETDASISEGCCGLIEYNKCVIRINKDMDEQYKNQTLIHEIVHVILCNLGYSEEAEKETFVQGLASAIYQTFDIKEVK